MQSTGQSRLCLEQGSPRFVTLYIERAAATMAEYMLPKYAKKSLEEKMKEITDEFETLWGFTQVIGTINGSHVPIIKPVESASDYFDQKGFYYIIIQGVVDSLYLLIDVNIG